MHKIHGHKNPVEGPSRSPSVSSHVLHAPTLRYPVPYAHHPQSSHPSRERSLTPPSFTPADFSATPALASSMLSHSRTRNNTLDTSTISQAGYADPGGTPRSLVPDILSAFFDAFERSKGPDSVPAQGPPASGPSTGGDANNPLEWPLHSTDARGYTAAPHANTSAVEADTKVDADWLDFLSGTTTVSASSNTEFTNLQSKPPNRLPTPSSPPGLASGPGANAGSGVQGGQFIGAGGEARVVRWTGDRADEAGPGPHT
ncbi:hypothetical protein L208DRAFT_777719 [Tricholoma matsutake]|nr:hypothetical protein L208DRAFT_777719 [Tricholoma matsutake 945]